MVKFGNFLSPNGNNWTIIFHQHWEKYILSGIGKFGTGPINGQDKNTCSLRVTQIKLSED